MRRLLSVLFLTCSISLSYAQFTDNFSDGNFTANPVWGGNTADFTVNPSFQLQSNNSVASSFYYLSTPSTLATSAQWEFYVQLTFNTSSLNIVDIYLTSTGSDVTQPTSLGYFVRLGNTDDEISLYRKDVGGTATKIIDGVNGILNTSNNIMKIKVTRNAANQFILYRDLSGTGTSYVSEGSVTDATFTTSAFFGIHIKQSTASFFLRHFFDDFVVSAFAPDVTPPVLTSATATAANTLDVLFDEGLDPVSSQVVGNYVANNGIGSPSTAVLDGTNPALVHLTFATNFPGGSSTLTVNGVKDVSGNAIVNGTANFSFVPSPPTIVSANATSLTTLDVLFNEPVEIVSSQTTANYSANNGIGNPTTASRDVTNNALVHLVFANSFPNGVNSILTVNGVKDIAGSPIVNGTVTFAFYVPVQYDIVIDELFADPSPIVGLPNNEWLELKNTSAFSINLQGWKIGDQGSLSGAMPFYILKPDSFVIVCTGSAVAAMSAFGPTISVTSFPTLDNDGDLLHLVSVQGKEIHAVNYSTSWYQNELKKDGGWTLEMIDTDNPCQGFSNWKASIDPSGGTPGRKNSIDADNADDTPPRVIRATASDNITVTVAFDEPVDSLQAATVSNYSISDGIGTPLSATTVGPLFDRVILKLNTPIVAGTVYIVTVNNVNDCSGNTVSGFKTARFGLTSVADSFDVVINEILFNPTPSQVDYVEIYNRSNKILDLKQLSIANRSSLGVISSIIPISTESISFFPGDFIVLTTDPTVIKQQFIIKNQDAFIQMSMPSYSDDDGNVVLLNFQGQIIDELNYDEDWHFELLDDNEGVSLERIDYNAPTVRDNFHSAATSAGYGTPGYVNSQFRMDVQVQGEVTVTPEIVSPDNDGFDDFATINYNFPERGYVANITIFDARGRTVRFLQRSALSAQKGSYRWDGLGEKGVKLNVGIYIIVTEIFNLQGKRKDFKNRIVLARRLN